MGRQTKAQQARKKAKQANRIQASATATKGQGTPATKFPYGLRGVKIKPFIGADGKPVRPTLKETLESLRETLSNIEGGGFKPIGKVQDSRMYPDTARQTMAKLMEMLQAKPLPILEQLKQVGVTVTYCRLPGSTSLHPDGAVLKLEEVQRADRQIASRGSLYDQIYGGKPV